MKLLLVSDDEKKANNIAEKLVFLRNDDSVHLSSYDNAITNTKVLNPDVILVIEHLSKQRSINTITELSNICDSSIIFVPNKYDQELILASVDAGANDFILDTAEGFEFVIRIVNNIKLKNSKTVLNRNIQLLEQQKVIDETNCVYSYEYSAQAIENTIDNDLITSGTFLIVTPSKDVKTTLNIDNFVAAIKSSIRSNDIVTKGKGRNMYIFMPKTNLNDAVVVLNKIKDKLNFAVHAGISEIANCSYNKFEKKALKALSEAMATKSDFVFAREDKTEDDENWLEDNSSVKNYKIFRQMYNKKMEKIIAPVFYRYQKAYEEKLYGTEIEQYTNDEQCVFKLKGKNDESSLNIIYPGFAKVIVEIVHSGLDSPENREIQFPLVKISQQDLADILEEFIKEYKNREI